MLIEEVMDQSDGDNPDKPRPTAGDQLFLDDLVKPAD
jgi:hypothetical protein